MIDLTKVPEETRYIRNLATNKKVERSESYTELK